MNDKQKLDLIFSLFLLMSFMSLYVTYELKNYECPTCQSCKTYNWEQINNSCDMRFPQKNITKGINGLYQHPDYYCVWTANRTPSDIAETTFHELAHYYQYTEPEHFKGVENNGKN